MVISIGEILVDMIGATINGVLTYQCFVGGAPYNVASDIKKLHGSSGFIGAVGYDLLGDSLINSSKATNFDYCNISRVEKANTTIALVQLDDKGERQFSFLRNKTADYQLDISLINEQNLADAKIVHLGSLMLSEQEGREYAIKAVDKIKNYNKLLSFDINYREDLFDNNDEAINAIKAIMAKADILKFSEEEPSRFSSCKTLDEQIYDITLPYQMVFVTLGEKGSCLYYLGKKYCVPSFKAKVVDTTGAGDAFYAGVLHQLDQIDISKLDESTICHILKFANVCGGLTTQGKGAVDAFPSLEEIERVLSTLC